MDILKFNQLKVMSSKQMILKLQTVKHGIILKISQLAYSLNKEQKSI